MNRFKKAFTFLLIALVFACQRDNLLRVVGVKDGDTIVVLTPDHQNITVRLAEVDCPEKSQAFGQAAKQFTSDLCFGKSVKLDGSEHDRYGRTVAKVILEDGRILNYELVKNGYAWQYKHYSNNPALAVYEQQAREQHLGLWQDPNPTPPWEFRQQKRQGTSNGSKEEYYPKKRKYKKHKSRKDNFPAFEYNDSL
ncbi:thermonuclease family protein [Mucilaginibacter sp. KACC 22063]|uniref:thermonuclease family protein n=1 Tax=Mucilaginibacter sp. KACC 22063 TaxID=3025666 RepID=UPI0023663566|nr:thermonuclease family protein [Mucilaginibacter sp. KACC 22063]WDF56661.1 thermonuclease family protein [Mucilaginibacter sp. KACC 22063]